MKNCIARAVGPAFSALLCALPLLAQAARLQTMSPLGEVPVVKQVRWQFDSDVMPQGDPRLPAPAELRCEGKVIAGNARWVGARDWVLDLPEALPAAQRCEVRLKPDWQPGVAGASAPAAVQHRFSTAGPAVDMIWPDSWDPIEEEQHFLLKLTGPIVPASLSKSVWCEAEGLGERLPVKIVDGAAREALIKYHRLKGQMDRVILLACQRPLAPGVKARLVWGAGVQAAQGSVATREVQKFEWQVRPRFEASFSCERERAQGPCMPLRPLRVRFSSPVPRALAEKVVVLAKPAEGQAQTLKPTLSADEATVDEISFAAPLPLQASLSLAMPADLKDESGRSLANAGSFPLRSATGAMPPLAKFAAAPFGILESDQKGGEVAMLPVTVRHVQADLTGLSGSGQVRVKRLDAQTSDYELLRWFARMNRYHESSMTAEQASLPPDQWMETVEELDESGKLRKVRQERILGTRELTMLASETGVQTAKLPMLEGTTDKSPRPFEVLGIPLPQPGYHLVEVESRLLGRALLGKQAPLYVRTGALVTNLGVHFKRGRESSLVWVTTLDRAQPVADAEVAVNDCKGKPAWRGKTNAQGWALIPRGFVERHDGPCLARPAWFVTARAKDAAGRDDLAFMFSDWMSGIEPWRFHQPTSMSPQSNLRAHTVLDRSLFRQGETVSMKPYLRTETALGLQPPSADATPNQLIITHDGSGEETTVPLTWPKGAGHGSAQWVIPKTAKMGFYSISLVGPKGRHEAGSFRVDAFRLPMIDARLAGPKQAQIAVSETSLALQLNYLSGGAMAQARAKVTALLRDMSPSFERYREFSFTQTAVQRTEAQADDEEAAASESAAEEARLLVANQALSTDAQGAATVTLKNLPKQARPMEVVAEVSFNDPNGEIQTARQTVTLWPSAVVVGLRSRSWVTKGGSTALQAVVLDTQGKPVAGHKLSLNARLSKIVSTRKRMVGGFYAYEQHERGKDLGEVCSGKTDEKGLFECDANLGSEPGDIDIVAQTKDDAGRVAKAAITVWVTGQGDNWFAQDNDDRIDVLAEKAELQPGETARLQVRMPFREATALVSIEREGVLETKLMTLRGDKPVIELPIPKGQGEHSWAPNVYVSVMVVRGRVRDVPWYSFFTWGWRSPSEWWHAWRSEGPEFQAPTAMVDLSKPSFKIGVAALRIGLAEHRLEVKLSTDKTQYAVRDKAKVSIQVSRNGQAVPGASVAFAAVDEALLNLSDNHSWDLLEAMMQQRDWGVETSTAHGEIIGRRHYGRKAVPAGGGGGRNPTRELFDTLLMWRAEVKLDAQGRAQLEVPINDALTRFRLVAVADASVKRSGGVQHDLFGTGQTHITVSQDLQMLSGLPPLAREGDQLEAGFTLRNTTEQAMTVQASLRAELPEGQAPLALPDKTVQLPAGAAQEVSWPVTIPAGVSSIRWLGTAQDRGGKARDQLAVTQAVVPAVPLRVWSASIQQVMEGQPRSVAVAPPADALPQSAQQRQPRGGVLAQLQPSLATPMPGVQRYFQTYPFNCLEQRSSKAVGLQDKALWSAIMADLPGYLDGEGLAHYYPPIAANSASGSDRLTAYLVSLADESGWGLPEGARNRMLDGLQAFVEGRLERRFQAPKADLDVRKLAALEALSRHGRALPKHLGSLQISPSQWPTAALLDWVQILRRVPGIEQRDARLQEAQNLLRSRMELSGTQLRFTTEATDYWWWLMDSPDANANRLVLAMAQDSAWREDMPRLVLGALGRQQRGAWLTTTANAWGVLAMKRFASAFERSPVTGTTQLSLGSTAKAVDWAASPQGSSQLLPWPESGSAPLLAQQQGSGRPWLTVQTLAAVPLKAPLEAGYSLERSVEAVSQQTSGQWRKGDVMRVRLTIQARADMAWVALQDPLPTGATIVGSGLGGDSVIATQGEGKKSEGFAPSYVERSHEAWKGVWRWLPQGKHVVEYTVRLNQPGQFSLPPSRIEGMYAPDNFAERPNAALKVGG